MNKKYVLSLLLIFALIFMGCSKNTSDNEDVINDGVREKEKVTIEIEETVNQENMNVARKYFEAVALNDLDSYENYFVEDSVLTVVSRDFKGKGAIRRFGENEVMGGTYRVLRSKQIEDDNIKILLQFTPKGRSNPEPKAVYDFKIENNKIINANLQYATEKDLNEFKELTLENSILIPNPFKQYLEGVSNNDADTIANAFEENALVIDVGRKIETRNKIRTWANNEVIILKYQIGSVTYTNYGAILINKIYLNSGNSFYANYNLIIEEGYIKEANLQYADDGDFEIE